MTRDDRPRRALRNRRIARLTLHFVAVSASATSVGVVHADELRVHAQGSLAHAVGLPQDSEFGFGGGAAISLELPLATVIGIQAGLGVVGLTNGSPAPSFVQPHEGTAIGLGMLGARFRPWGGSGVAGPWVAADAGVAHSGSLNRFAFDAQVGWDFRVLTGRWDVGPFLGYTQIVEPDSSYRPQDAHLLSLGVQISLGARAKEEAPTVAAIADKDHDGIPDEEDTCPDQRGVHTSDINTNGCAPLDADGDGIDDDSDACPATRGIATKDVRTNGCPPGGPDPDRDKDRIANDTDACPDTPGPASDDPKKNGCPPLDKDNDGVLDGDDACPTVPGIASSDPKTNGCPASVGDVALSGDEIVIKDALFFDNDSPRVGQASLAVVQRIAEFIKSNDDVLEVNIEGHADAAGTPEHNLALSQQRANSVKRLLVQFGVSGTRLTTHAFGQSRPVVNAEGAEARNRRVEFSVTRARARAGAKR